MMKINLKQPKYVLPLILLPFFCFFFYTWQSGFANGKPLVKETKGFNGSVGNVSASVRKKQLSDKLDAYRDTYKESNGTTAVNAIESERSSNPSYNNEYSELQQEKLNSMNQAMKAKFTNEKINRSNFVPSQDDQMTKAVNAMTHQLNDQHPQLNIPAKEKDPMEVFKQQMAIMDSISKQNDPVYKDELKKKIAAQQAIKLKKTQVVLAVSKALSASDEFNTVSPVKQSAFISAVIDENITGYAGSRLRLKLLEDISAGNIKVNKGSYVYAQINGFSDQRVSLEITSILYDGKILPVKLLVYDMDGMPGLYVPSSAFRDFTKDLGESSVQGVTVDGGSGNGQFMMSSLDKVFKSTSSAIADLIRKNKAKLKYNSHLYLIDTEALQSAQKSY
jgi:conjugative transposon TraM protein